MEERARGATPASANGKHSSRSAAAANRRKLSALDFILTIVVSVMSMNLFRVIRIQVPFKNASSV